MADDAQPIINPTAENAQDPASQLTSNRIYARLAAIAVFIYGVLAGYRTMDDPDMWWQLAAGRDLLATHHIATTEIYSYTAKGAPWIYPVGSGVIFHLLYLVGGFTLLSLLSPMVMATITYSLVRKGGLLRSLAVALAIPAIANATFVRANMFSTLLAAAFLVVLWDEMNPWILPPLMLLWVNLHPGFIYGLAIVIAFTLIRPRKLGLVTAATSIATLINPWGWRLYEAIGAQGAIMTVHRSFIGEWRRAPLSWPVIHDALFSLDAEDGMWWLIALAATAAIAGLFHKRLWGSLIVAGSLGAALMYVRFQGLFCIAAAIVVPDLLDWKLDRPAWQRVTKALAIAFLALIALRCYDLASDHYYHRHIVMQTFGTGPSRWVPFRAMQFIADHHPPVQLYEDYVMGGVAIWSLPNYPVYIDGRALPYGVDVFFDQIWLTALNPDKPRWKRAIDTWKIHTVIISLERFMGYRGAPLDGFCASKDFALIYADDTAVVFTTASETSIPVLNCKTVTLAPPAESAPASERYHFWANAGAFYYALHRVPESAEAFRKVQAIWDADATVHQEVGQVLTAQGRLNEAERAFKASIALRPSDIAWQALGDLYVNNGRPQDAMDAYRESIARAPEGYKEWNALAETALAAGDPHVAADAADKTLTTSRLRDADEAISRNERARAYMLKGMANLAMFQVNESVAALQEASRLSPPDPKVQGPLQAGLADAYKQSGRLAEARAAFKRAKELGAETGIYGPMMKRLEWQLGVM